MKIDQRGGLLEELYAKYTHVYPLQIHFLVSITLMESNFLPLNVLSVLLRALQGCRDSYGRLIWSNNSRARQYLHMCCQYQLL